MLNMRNEEKNTVVDSDAACFVNTFSLNMYVFMLYTGYNQAEYDSHILVAPTGTPSRQSVTD